MGEGGRDSFRRRGRNPLPPQYTPQQANNLFGGLLGGTNFSGIFKSARGQLRTQVVKQGDEQPRTAMPPKFTQQQRRDSTRAKRARADREAACQRRSDM